jgi:hypothetical protein
MLLPTLASFLVLLTALNLWGWQSDILGLIVGSLYLILTGYLLGGRLARFSENLLERIIWGVAITLLIIASLGSLIFYIHLFTTAVTIVIFATIPWLGKYTHTPTEKINKTQTKQRWLIPSLLTMYLGLVTITIIFLTQNQTNEAIRTPWQTIPLIIFILYGLCAVLCLALSYYFKRPAWLIPFYFLSLGLLPLIYSLGFGFDPFIHQASEKLLALSGTITPKPFYYLGQYTLVVALSNILRLSINTIDIWLLPILASLLTPLATAVALRSFKLERPWIILLPLIPLAFTLPVFTYTTPQGLANLWALITILLLAAKSMGQKISSYLLALLIFTALVTHPLTGLPLLGITVLYWFIFEQRHEVSWRKKAIWLTAAGTALVVPLAFVGLSLIKLSPTSIKLNSNFMESLVDLGQSIMSHLPFWPLYLSPIDTLYLWGRPLVLIFIVLASIGFWHAKKLTPVWHFFILAASLVAIGFIILKLCFTFVNLPLNEQDFYSIRLWNLALLCLTPLVLLGGLKIGQWLKPKFSSPLPWILMGSLILTASFYLTYPRMDTWQKDTAYNTTPADVAAVKLIAETAGDLPYVVLANQAVSAAAVREFGFTNYYAGNFYYPIPTGTNPLYQIYLDATEKSMPKRDIIAQAAQLANVPQVYLVLNRYWADFLKLAPIASQEADQKWIISDDKIQVFRYDF